jgi:F0F1-type ATP synthase assembly protein I
MTPTTVQGPTHIERDPDKQPDMIPREYLRVIAVWSIIPAYIAAGAFLGWLADLALHTSPYGVGVGLLVGLIMAVRDMLRLRDGF